MKIYGFGIQTFNSCKAVLTAEELELDFELVKLDALVGEHQQAKHLERHPLGKIPVLEDQNGYLFESMAIMRYLVAQAGSSLAGTDPWQRALIDQWCEYTLNHVGRGVGILYWEECVKPKFRGEASNEAMIAAAKTQLERELPVLEQALGERNHIATDDYSLADITFLSYALALEYTSESLEPYANLSEWYKRAAKRPASLRMEARYQQ